MTLRTRRPLILCDTNILLPILRQRIENQKRAPDNRIKPLSTESEINFFGEDRALICPVITGELYVNMYKREISATKELLRKFKNYPFDKEISRIFEHLMYSYRNYNPAVADTLIAATAIVARAEIWTNNRRHFAYFEEVILYRPILQHKFN